MSTVAEIEKAIEKLPPEQWQEIRRWMDRHAPSVPEVDKMAKFDNWLEECTGIATSGMTTDEIMRITRGVD